MQLFVVPVGVDAVHAGHVDYADASLKQASLGLNQEDGGATSAGVPHTPGFEVGLAEVAAVDGYLFVEVFGLYLTQVINDELEEFLLAQGAGSKRGEEFHALRAIIACQNNHGQARCFDTQAGQTQIAASQAVGQRGFTALDRADCCHE